MERPGADADAARALCIEAFPQEMLREILIRLNRWEDLKAAMAAWDRFHSSLARSDVWVRKYGPQGGHDITTTDEPLEAYEVLYSRWGMRVPGFSTDGLVRLARVGHFEPLAWFDSLLDRYIPKAHDYQSEHNRARAKAAEEAAAAGHVNIVVHMLRSLTFSGIRGYNAAVICMREAIRADRVAVVAALHELAPCSAKDDYLDDDDNDDGDDDDDDDDDETEDDGDGSDGETPQWPPPPRGRAWCCDAGMAATVARSISVSEWLARNGCVNAPGLQELECAVREGNKVMVQWILGQEGNRWRCEESWVNRAAYKGHLDFVMWLHESGIKHCSPRTLARAVEGGRDGTRDEDILRLLEWATSPATPTKKAGATAECRVPGWGDSGLPVFAVRAGSVALVRWLYERWPDLFTREVVRKAVRSAGTHPEIMLYLDSIGLAPVSSYQSLSTILNRAFWNRGYTIPADGLERLAAAGAPLSDSDLQSLIDHRRYDLLAPLLRGYERAPAAAPDPDRIMRAAIRGGYKSVRWVRDNVSGARLCVATSIARQKGWNEDKIAGLGRCRCAECAAGSVSASGAETTERQGPPIKRARLD